MRASTTASLSAGDVQLVTSDAVKLHARWYAGDDSDPSAPCYLLGHGFTGSSARADVIRICRHLAATGGAVLSLDFRGHGGSAGRSSVGVSETADIAAGVAWLRNRHRRRPIVLLGFSMGAAIVVSYAGGAEQNRTGEPMPRAVDAVIAVSGPGRWFVRSTPPMRLLNRGLETLAGRFALRTVLGARVDRGWVELPAAPVELAGAITCPALIVHGDADPYFTLEHPRMLAAQIAGSQLWIESGMGHAESATDSALLDRIVAWSETVTSKTTTHRSTPSATIAL
jgi:pimeloyl-ACP methyl ester carboxylesterase